MLIGKLKLESLGISGNKLEAVYEDFWEIDGCLSYIG